jgi:hypothetical protein
LIDSRSTSAESNQLGVLVGKLIYSVEQRTSDLECALAKARHVPLRRISLGWNEQVAAWEFAHTPALIEHGYNLALQEIAGWPKPRRSWWARWRDRSNDPPGVR